jgi:alanyl-tRNA synthetase
MRFEISLSVTTMILAAVATVRSFVPLASRHRGVVGFASRLPATAMFSTKEQQQQQQSASDAQPQQKELVWTTDKVRATFCEFFEERDHFPQPSSACAPLNDPTLLFTNAGMNQYKPIFLGQADPNSPLASLKRACNSQKCIRAGGKHNDLEDVGRDTYHHTFFEMLGSWSFGDYFKKEAIDYAWELLTKVYKMDPDRIYATYFEGDDQVPVDTEARDLWLQYLPKERIIACSAKDNFWEVRILY